MIAFLKAQTPKVSTKNVSGEFRFPYEISDVQKLQEAITRGNDSMLSALFDFGIFTGGSLMEQKTAAVGLIDYGLI